MLLGGEKNIIKIISLFEILLFKEFITIDVLRRENGFLNKKFQLHHSSKCLNSVVIGTCKKIDLGEKSTLHLIWGIN